MNTISLLNGPVYVAPNVREAFASPVCDLRHPRFLDAFERVKAGVRENLGASDYEVVLASGSGTFGIELVLRACIRPRDRVLAVVTGTYGERMAHIAEIAGARVWRMEAALGAVVDEEDLARALEESGPFDFVTLVHVEPSTGTQVRLPDLAPVCRRAGATLLVDAICSAFALPIGCGDLAIGALVTASQKGLALPPGMALAVVAPDLVERARSSPEERTGYYGRLERWLGPGFQFTPPIAHVFAADASLANIRAETPSARGVRHVKSGMRVRSWAREHGLALVPESEDAAADTLTALYYPDGRDDAWLRRLRDERGLELAPVTHPRIAGKGFRIGHLGDLPEDHLTRGLEILAAALDEVTP